jgi:D-glycero-alpha-D-manno-heptose-7-phosphate kinase
MIITRTPLRISFVGGGSDMAEFYRENGGAVLSAALAKYVYLSMHPYFHEQKIFLKYSHSELVDSAEQIQHRIIREVFSAYGITGVDFNSSADVPAGTGLGSSSSFTVGLINLCNAYIGRRVTAAELAESACRVEIGRLQEPIGKQDQYAAAFGGMNLLHFHPDDSVRVERIAMTPQKYQQLQKNLVMYYLGQTRVASEVLLEQQNNIRSDRSKIATLCKMVQLARDLFLSLGRGDLDVFGEALHAGWMYKKELAKGISNQRIDHYYDKALRNGAQGGKLLGAGGSGFLLFYVAESEQERLHRALDDLDAFNVVFDDYGSTLIDLNQVPTMSAPIYIRTA